MSSSPVSSRESSGLLIDEQVNDAGEFMRYVLVRDAQGISLYAGETPVGYFSAAILSQVVTRYSRPLEDGQDFAGDSLVLAPGQTLVAWYYRAPVDLEQKLYLVLTGEDQPPRAVLARQIVGALIFLGKTQSP